MSHTPRNLDHASRVARAVAGEAGLLMLASYRKGQEISFKGDVDLVTQVDLDCEALIRRRLSQSFPGDSILAEEGGATEAERPSDGLNGEEISGRWIVDPLDGTTNYAHGHPFFCVSMALEVEGRLELGVIHAPVLGLTWTARRGAGAFRNGEPIEVSRVETVSRALCVSGFPYDRWTNEDNNVSEWGAVVRAAQGVRRNGSAAIDLAMVADGTFDGYWEKRLNPWDMSAGALLVLEAGGRCEGLDGRPIPPWPRTIVASNGLIHDELVGLLKKG